MRTCTSNIAATVAAAGLATIAQAQYTTVNPPPGGESGHAAILSNMYGGSWSASGMNITGSTAAAIRFTDSGVSSGVGLPMFAPALTQDDVWTSQGEVVTVVAKAKFAGNSHIFGWFDDTQTDPTFQPLFSTGDFNQPVTFQPSESFRWALRNTSTGRTFTSRPSDNLGIGGHASQSFDQLVTYHVTNPSGLSEIALFWEDRIGGESPDYDYNDAVIALAVVPAPGTGVLAGLGLLGMTGRRRRRCSVNP